MKRFLAIMAVAGSMLLPATAQADDWMARLSDEAPVAQLCIPGTHDSGTGHGFAGLLAGIYNGTSRTQDQTLTGQWDSGIRAFDLRPTVKGGELLIYHGVSQTNIKFNECIETLVNLLDAHPTEFAVISMRHETDSDNNSSEWAGKVTTILQNTARYHAHLVAWRPDLTVAECRGKIIVLTRDDFDCDARGLISSWPGTGAPSFASLQVAGISRGTQSASLWVQDVYECTADGRINTKVQYMKKMLTESAKLCQPGSPDNVWVINHTSGYTKSASSDNNRETAAVTNKAMIDHLTSADYVPGPTGIVLMDFAGGDVSNNRSVLGQKLTNTLIENNFRYTYKAPMVTTPLTSVKVSTEFSAHWLVLRAALRANLALSEQGSNAAVGVNDISGERAHWKITDRGDGTYNLVNRATGHYLNPRSGGFNSPLYTLGTEPTAGWEFAPAATTSLWVIYSRKAGAELNQTNPGDFGEKVYNYGYSDGSADKNDTGCQYAMALLESEESDEAREPQISNLSTTYWHHITCPAREGRYVVQESVYSSVTGVLPGHDDAAGSRALWQFAPREDGTYNVVNRATGKFLNPDASRYNLPVNATITVPEHGWSIEHAATSGLYIIYSGSECQLNQTEESNRYQVFNWGNQGVPDKADDGCQFEIYVASSHPNLSGTIAGVDEVSVDESSAADSGCEVRYYDMSGRLLKRVTMPGIYIVDGQKRVITDLP